MAARILDGASLALQIRRELSARAAEFASRAGRRAKLGIVLVGDRADSHLYVNSKLKSAADEGMDAGLTHLPASVSIEQVLSVVRDLNQDSATDGILVQSPLPAGLGSDALQRVFDTIEPAKDVDGVT